MEYGRKLGIGLEFLIITYYNKINYISHKIKKVYKKVYKNPDSNPFELGLYHPELLLHKGEGDVQNPCDLLVRPAVAVAQPCDPALPLGQHQTIDQRIELGSVAD